MKINLTNKERMLLQDLKKHEELCVQKYQNYAGRAQDPQLKQLFSSLAQKEQQHLNSITQLLNGQLPNMQQSGGQQQGLQAGQQMQQSMPGQQMQQNMQSSQQMQQSMQSNQQMQQNHMQGAMANQDDKTLCTDMLATEKYVSGTYDTAIFEFTDTNVRKILNHIQKEEQEHGEQIFKYMQSKGMYNPQ